MKDSRRRLRKLNDITVDMKILRDIVRPFEKTVDTVVLGCTHYPILKEELKNCLSSVTHWVDSGEAIARRTKYICSMLNICAEDKSSSNYR